jgi:hypothetical protein
LNQDSPEERTELTNVYPIPAARDLYVSSGFNSGSYAVISITGKVMYEGRFETSDFEVPLVNFDRGIYLLRINRSNQTEVLRFVVGH